MLITALAERSVVEGSSDNRLKLSIAVNLVDCLLTFLKGMSQISDVSGTTDANMR